MAGAGHRVRYLAVRRWLLAATACTPLLHCSMECSMLDARSQCDAGEGIREEEHREGQAQSRPCFMLLCGPQEFAKRRRPLTGFLSGLFDHIQLDLGRTPFIQPKAVIPASSDAERTCAHFNSPFRNGLLGSSVT